jgi:ankyrin repeat protein
MKLLSASVLLGLFSGRMLLPQTSLTSDMLAKAVITDDVNALDHLLSSGLNPNLTDRYSQTPLYVAILYRNSRAVHLLLVNHADPNAPLNRRATHPLSPLQYAAREGDSDIVSLLLSAGAHMNDQGATGRGALHYAVQSNQLDVIHFLLEKGADVNARDGEGASPLDDAVWRRSLDAVAILLAHGARLDDADSETGATPLNEAAFRGDEKIVAYLLQFHPDVTTPDKNGYSPFQNALRRKNENCAVLLMDAMPKERPTQDFFAKAMDAAITGNEPRMVQALLRRNVPVNSPLPSGLTPLNAAAATGNAEIVRLLLSNHADPNVAAATGGTPLEDASLKGFESVAALLLDHGARIDQVNRDSGTTALYAAASFGRAVVVNLLLERGASPNLCGSNRKTPLEAATENGFSEIAASLRSRGGVNRCAP